MSGCSEPRSYLRPLPTFNPLILYLTYNDQPSGVYWSQVTDVVAHLNSLGPRKVRLVALVSGRGFRKTKRLIRERSPDAMVLPMVPQMKRWRMNTLIVNWVCRRLRPAGIIARGVMATYLAQHARSKGLVNKVCFDGRGAYAAEWEEYRIIDDDGLIAQFRPLEDAAVNRSDFRIAVSNALVDHWKERYGYTKNDHEVIPCTLGSDHRPSVPQPSAFNPRLSATTLVYSGSTAGWQSFELLEKLLTEVLDRQPDVRVLFLSKADQNNQRLMQKYPGRVEVKWLTPDQVQPVLASCDHGILIREDTTTNRVASPTKFAEYLAAGLPVIISEHLGDFSELVQRDDLGMVLQEGSGFGKLTPTTDAKRVELQEYARTKFSKQAHNSSYERLLERLCDPG